MAGLRVLPGGDLPPHSLEAERQVLGTVLVKPELLPAIELTTADFYSDANARIWAAIQYCGAEGIELDQLHVRERLVELGLLAAVGGDDYLLGLTDVIPDVAPADIVRKLARQRGVDALGKQLSRSAQSGDLVGAQTAVREIQRVLDEADRRPVAEWRTVFEVFEPLPPVPWRVRGLQICPGRPSAFVGYGASAKTLAAQALALACASGLPAWQHFETSPIQVRHLDYEQGWRATARRYQRLAHGMGMDQRCLGDRLRVAIFPHVYLDQEGAYDAMARLCEGAELVIIDSLKACTPSSDENDNGVRRCIDVLTRVSEVTGAAFLLLHHAGKGEVRDQRAVGRGASAIFDACGSWFNFFAGKRPGDARTVHQAKMPAESEGLGVKDFMLDVLDVHDPGQPNAGLRVAYKPLEEPDPLSEAGLRYDSLVRNVLEVVRRNPGKPREEIAARAGVAKSTCLQVLEQLERDGHVRTELARSGARLMYPANGQRGPQY